MIKDPKFFPKKLQANLQSRKLQQTYDIESFRTESWRSQWHQTKYKIFFGFW